MSEILRIGVKGIMSTTDSQLVKGENCMYTLKAKCGRMLIVGFYTMVATLGLCTIVHHATIVTLLFIQLLHQ